MRRLSPDAFHALEHVVCVGDGWTPIRAYMEPEEVAWFCVRLKFYADSLEAFPRGKWATIQQMQAMLDEAAEKESK